MRVFLITDNVSTKQKKATLLKLPAVTDFSEREFDQIADLLPGESYQLSDTTSIRRIDLTH